MENCHLSASNLFFAILKVLLGQKSFRREQKLRFLKNITSRTVVFEIPLGVYKVKTFVRNLINLSMAKFFFYVTVKQD